MNMQPKGGLERIAPTMIASARRVVAGMTMMLTSVATMIFTVMMATAIASLVWDLTRHVRDPADQADNVREAARAEARRIAALPRTVRAARGLGVAARPVRVYHPVAAPVRLSRPTLAAAA